MQSSTSVMGLKLVRSAPSNTFVQVTILKVRFKIIKTLHLFSHSVSAGWPVPSSSQEITAMGRVGTGHHVRSPSDTAQPSVTVISYTLDVAACSNWLIATSPDQCG